MLWIALKTSELVLVLAVVLALGVIDLSCVLSVSWECICVSSRYWISAAQMVQGYLSLMVE